MKWLPEPSEPTRHSHGGFRQDEPSRLACSELGDVIDLRLGPGPRDWDPASPDGGPGPRMESSRPQRRPAWKEPVHPARGIGLLAILLGVGTLAVAIWLLDGRELGVPAAIAMFGAAIAASIAGIALTGLPRRTRTAAWCALTLVLASGAIVGLSAFRAGQIAPHPASLTASTPLSSTDLAQSAGTLAYLMEQSSSGCPEVLAPTSAGMFVLPAGNLSMPVGASFSYETDGAGGCSFSFTHPGAGTAQWDSASRAVTTGP